MQQYIQLQLHVTNTIYEYEYTQYTIRRYNVLQYNVLQYDDTTYNIPYDDTIQYTRYDDTTDDDRTTIRYNIHGGEELLLVTYNKIVR